MPGHQDIETSEASIMVDVAAETGSLSHPKRKRFRPWNGLRRMFRRKSRSEGGASNSGMASSSAPEGFMVERRHRGQGSGAGIVTACIRSRSTSELLASDSPDSERRLPSAADYSPVSQTVSAAYSAGLSVSHDSVFSPEASVLARDNLGSSASSLSNRQLVMKDVQAELRLALRQRRTVDTSEEDLGLPSSMCTSPIAELPTSPYRDPKSISQSTGSNGSFASMGSFELEDVLAISDTVPNRTSAKTVRPTEENAEEMGADSAAFPLSHSAARHKMAVRPKKTRAASRTRLQQLANLPSTPEDMEYVTAERPPKPRVAESNTSLLGFSVNNPIPVVAEQTKPSSVVSPALKESKVRSLSLSRAVDKCSTTTESSAAAGSETAPAKLARSKSNADRKPSRDGSVAFWRLHRNKDKNKPSEASSTSSLSPTEKDDNSSSHSHSSKNSEVKRKELRKIKRSKEEKKRLKESQNTNSSTTSAGDGVVPVSDALIENSPPMPAFFSRLFGSRRSSRKKKSEAQTLTDGLNEAKTQLALPRVPDAKSNGDSERKISETLPNELDQDNALSSSGEDKGYESLVITPDMLLRTESGRFAKPVENPPSAQVRSSVSKVKAEPSEMSSVPPTLGDPSQLKKRLSDRSSLQASHNKAADHMSLLDPELRPKAHDWQVEPTRPKLNIAGLSPYQRRVARIGNELEISDDETDELQFAESYKSKRSSVGSARNSAARRAQSFRQEELPAGDNEEDNLTSLPVDIHKDFILKKSPPYEDRTSARSSASSSEIQRSLETLKWSNEGLKKAIDSLQPSLNRSPEQFRFSDDSTKRSAESLSTDSSSLNISETDLEPLTPASSAVVTSRESLDKSSLGLSAGHRSSECLSLNGSETEKFSSSPSPTFCPAAVVGGDEENGRLPQRQRGSPNREIDEEQHSRKTDAWENEICSETNRKVAASPPQIRFRVISKSNQLPTGVVKLSNASASGANNNSEQNTRINSAMASVVTRHSSSANAPESPEFRRIQLQKIEVRNPTNVILDTEKNPVVKKGSSSQEMPTLPALKASRSVPVSAANNEKPMFALSVNVRNPPGFYIRSLSTPSDSFVAATATSPLQSPTKKVAMMDATIREAHNALLSSKDPTEAKSLLAVRSHSFDEWQPLTSEPGTKAWLSNHAGMESDFLAEKVVEIIEANPGIEVVMRRGNEAQSAQPLSPQLPGRNEESELLKVFARRSLKMKETESDEVAVATSSHPIEGGRTKEKLGASAKPALAQTSLTFREHSIHPKHSVTPGDEAKPMTTMEASTPTPKLTPSPWLRPTSPKTNVSRLADRPSSNVDISGNSNPMHLLKQELSGNGAHQPSLSVKSRVEKISSPESQPAVKLDTQDAIVIVDTLLSAESNSSPTNITGEPVFKSARRGHTVRQSEEFIGPTPVETHINGCVSDEVAIYPASGTQPCEPTLKKGNAKPRISRLQLRLANDLSASHLMEPTEEVQEVSRTVVPRQSKVLDMVNTFQRLQVT